MDPPVGQMTQIAPWPAGLADLVRQVSYRPGWTVKLGHLDRGQGSEGLTLIITTSGYDSYHPEAGEGYRVNHFMPVPPAAYDARSWLRWLFEQFLLVERHEAMEFFTVAGGKPYAPSHGPGNDCYLVREVGTEDDQRMRYTGEDAGTPAQMPPRG
jgi:hypothetical protein